MLKLPNAKVTMENLMKMNDVVNFEHALIFDNVLIVSNPATCCQIIKTSEGLILIDAIFPHENVFNAIVDGIKAVGWDPTQIKKFIITHGHPDHTGCGKWIIENFNPDVYISKIDYDMWREKPLGPGLEADFEVHNFIDEGDVITLGDVDVKVYFTPGHTPGGLSLSFPVKDLGVTHIAAIWGGSNPPGDLKMIITYFRSLDEWIRKMENINVDVALGAHPFLDNGLERMNVARNRLSHMPNPFILGTAGFRQYTQLFRDMCYERLEEMSAK